MEESGVYSTTLPKISHAEMQMWSLPQWFLPMLTSLIKRQGGPAVTSNVPVNKLPLRWSFSSTREISVQLSPSVDVSTSHDLRWGP
jgi:S-formylglutathione hydrolase FrmB